MSNNTRANTPKEEKVKVSLAINKEVYEKAHSLGINVSKASENMLKELIDAIEGRKGFLVPDSFTKVSGEWCSGRDLDPGPRLERPLYLVP